MPNVLHAIGNTPLVRINKIAKTEGLECELRKLHVIGWYWVMNVLYLFYVYFSFQLPSASFSTQAAVSRTGSA